MWYARRSQTTAEEQGAIRADAKSIDRFRMASKSVLQHELHGNKMSDHNAKMEASAHSRK
jgi:hypothetical protein